MLQLLIYDTFYQIVIYGDFLYFMDNWNTAAVYFGLTVWREILYSSIPDNGLSQQGMVQRKPGRGDTTLSVSCSDKIARWNVVGVQG